MPHSPFFFDFIPSPLFSLQVLLPLSPCRTKRYFYPHPSATDTHIIPKVCYSKKSILSLSLSLSSPPCTAITLGKKNLYNGFGHQLPCFSSSLFFSLEEEGDAGGYLFYLCHTYTHTHTNTHNTLRIHIKSHHEDRLSPIRTPSGSGFQQHLQSRQGFIRSRSK